MPDPSALGWFVVASVLLVVTPGPAVLYIVARALDQGRLAGLVSALGVALGTFVHVGAAALGLSALVLSSAVAFGIVKYLGAAYLVLLGVRRLVAPEAPAGPPAPRSHALRRVLVDGFVVNALNPKTALFFLAFLPQFADPARGGFATQMVALGLLFTVIALQLDVCVVLLADRLRRWMGGHAATVERRRYVTGSVYIALGLGAALADVGD